MGKDIRLSTQFIDHPKTKKMIKKCGYESVVCLLRLWCWCSSNRPNGVLSNMDDDDIEIVSGWTGDDGEFLKYINGIWVDENDGIYSLHDWEENQPWVFHSSDRSKKAREAAKKKWGSSDSDDLTSSQKRSKRLSDARDKGTHTNEDWEDMVSYFSDTCVRCGEKTKIVKDHIVPIYQGGSDCIKNLQPLCKSCNSSKGPENIDFRGYYCEKMGAEMPAKWLHDGYGISTDSRENEREMSAPLPSPSPLPNPKPKKTLSDKPDDGQGSFYLTAKKKKLSGKRLEAFEEFWEAFDYKKSKSSAADSWLALPRLDNKIMDAILSGARREASGRKARIESGGTPKMAQGWITERRWEDEVVSGPGPGAQPLSFDQMMEDKFKNGQS